MPDSVTREDVQTLVRNGWQLIEVLGPRQYAEAQPRAGDRLSHVYHVITL